MPKPVPLLLLSESVLKRGFGGRGSSITGGGRERKRRQTHTEGFALDTGHAETPTEEERTVIRLTHGQKEGEAPGLAWP